MCSGVVTQKEADALIEADAVSFELPKACKVFLVRLEKCKMI